MINCGKGRILCGNCPDWFFPISWCGSFWQNRFTGPVPSSGEKNTTIVEIQNSEFRILNFGFGAPLYPPQGTILEPDVRQVLEFEV
jgi:hypothetical protein